MTPTKRAFEKYKLRGLFSESYVSFWNPLTCIWNKSCSRTILLKFIFQTDLGLTSAPLARTYTNRIFESKDGTTTTKIVNWIARHNFCLNDLLTKSSRRELQSYKVEERSFGTPCNLNLCCKLAGFLMFAIFQDELKAKISLKAFYSQNCN